MEKICLQYSLHLLMMKKKSSLCRAGKSIKYGNGAIFIEHYPPKKGIVKIVGPKNRRSG